VQIELDELLREEQIEFARHLRVGSGPIEPARGLLGTLRVSARSRGLMALW